MKLKIFRKRSRTVVAALILISVAGCAGRKQYQINEAILISERRQLEDELYRLQFELRDALEENERLRAAAGNAANDAPNGVLTAQNNGANGSAALFPPSNALKTARPTRGAARLSTVSANSNGTRAANSENYRDAGVAPSTGGAVETLPDYVPVPLTSAPSPKASRPNAKTLGVRRSVANAASPAAPVATSKIAASNYVANAAETPNVETTSYQNKTENATNAPAVPIADADAWSPFPR